MWLLLLALLLLILALILYGKLAPAPRPDGQGEAFAAPHRVAILAALEGGWGSFLLALRRALLYRAGILGRALRKLAMALTVAGVVAGGLGGWLAWSFLSAKVHGTPSGHHHHDWD